MTIKVTIWPDEDQASIITEQKLIAITTNKSKSTLIRDFGRLLESGTGSDVVIRVGEKDFRVHRVILSARSNVMKAMFTEGRFKEGISIPTTASTSSSSTTTTTTVIEMKDIEEETMMNLLRFICTGSVDDFFAVVGDEDGGGEDDQQEETGRGEEEEEEKKEKWKRLLRASDRFDVQDLFEKAQEELGGMID